MKKTEGKAKKIRWTIPVLLLLTAPAASAAGGEELLVNSYLNEQANRRMEQIVPKGEYTVQVNAFLKKAEAEESITLPFASSPITMWRAVMSANPTPTRPSIMPTSQKRRAICVSDHPICSK